jgi:hypothetical protein
MRIVRQYPKDSRRLVFRLAILAVLMACLYVLVNRVAYAVATNYYDIEDEAHDRQVLSQLDTESPPVELDARILQKETILKQLRNEKVIRKVRGELGALYELKGTRCIQVAEHAETKGNASVATSKRSLGEYLYLRAIEFAPNEPEYYANLGRLELKASHRQSDSPNRYALLRDATWELQKAADVQRDIAQRKVRSAEAAACTYEFAQFELSTPAYRSSALADLQRAKKLADPTSDICRRISVLLQSSS